jgi:hypothetical protein
MRQIRAIAIVFLLALGIYSCSNEDWSFPDFDYTTTYFPYQFPVRTLVLGDYYFDNTSDNLHKFKVSVNTGGMYANKKNITVDFVVDTTLVRKLYNNVTGVRMLPLPENYYTLSNGSTITVPAGQFNGSVDVQLTDDFFSDPLAIGNNYVLPLRITESTTDSILSGKSSVTDPDPRIASNWIIVPKNYTLFCVKYVNEYHGSYLLRGGSNITGGTNPETVIYRNKYLEKNEIATVNTSGRKSVIYSNKIRLTTGNAGNFEVNIVFDDNGNAVVSNTSKYTAKVTGTGKLVKGAESWNDKPRDVIYLDYQIVEGARTHAVKDTLVFRDKNVKIEEFTPQVR